MIVVSVLMSTELTAIYDRLTSEVMAQETVKTEVKKLEDGQTTGIPLLSQERNLSCEAAAIRMILNYFGEDVSEQEILAGIPKNPNPYLGFRGNVDGKVWGFNDYGTYAPAVVKSLGDFRIPATAFTNISEEFLKQKILSGKPAIIWVNTTNPNPEVKLTKINGTEVKLVSGEHTVVVSGFKNGKWQINDPWNTTEKGERQAKTIEVEHLDDIYWHLFDHMAVIVN